MDMGMGMGIAMGMGTTMGLGTMLKIRRWRKKVGLASCLVNSI